MWLTFADSCKLAAMIIAPHTCEVAYMKSNEWVSARLRSRITLAQLWITLFLITGSSKMSGAEMKVEDVVARHLNSIGTSDARSAVKSRIVQGTSRFKMVVGGGGELQGTSALVSEGRKSVVMVKFANGDYRGEQFVTDGDRVSVASTTSNHRRSAFGEFVHSQDQIVREGLLGGALTTAWALSHLDDNKARLNFDGEKKVDGRSAYQLTYHARKNDDMTVHLFFDSETFHHVMTTYAITLASGLAPNAGAGAADVTQSSRQKEIRYTIEERYGEFATTEGLTLPSKYSIHFTRELQNGSTEVWEWDITAEKSSSNISLDPKNFEVKQ